MRIFISFIFLLISVLFSLGQSINISGKATGAEEQTIRLMAEEDFISHKMVVLARDRIDEGGNFELNFNAKETFRAFLDINSQWTEIFLEPGSSYNIELSLDPGELLKSYFDRTPIPYKLINAPAADINKSISSFDALYNQFVLDNFNRIYVVRDRSLVKDFRMEVDSIFDSSDNQYFEDYIRYKFAGLEQLARIKSKQTIAKEYFQNNPILYKNLEYTFFFSDFFGQVLLTSPSLITMSDLILAVNFNDDLQAIDSALLKTGFLDDQRLRELVLLLNLRDIYGHGSFYQDKVMNMIDQLGNQSQFDKHKMIAKNLIEEFQKLIPGSPAPNLKLSSIGGYDFQLKDLRSKPTLLMFFQTGQKITTTYLDELSAVYEKFKAGMEVICVSMDQDPMKYLPLANSGRYGWSFAHYGNRPEVFDLYNIKDLPLFVLIDVEGKIAMYPAPPPGEELEKGIRKVIH